MKLSSRISQQSRVTIWLSFSGLLIASIVAIKPAFSADQMKLCELKFDNDVVLFNVPVATTRRQQETGLMSQDDVKAGMLFSWSGSEQRAFWMRDTPKALSVGFLDNAGVLFEIQDMQPFSEEKHVSRHPAQEALELPLGRFSDLDLVPGTRLVERHCS